MGTAVVRGPGPVIGRAALRLSKGFINALGPFTKNGLARSFCTTSFCKCALMIWAAKYEPVSFKWTTSNLYADPWGIRRSRISNRHPKLPGPLGVFGVKHPLP